MEEAMYSKSSIPTMVSSTMKPSLAIPPRYEDEYPEAGALLAEICTERAEQRAKGKRLKPLVLDAPETFVADKSVGRNDPCPCGSGKKYKKCCN
jgi:preprotein translocase subunit SecA